MLSHVIPFYGFQIVTWVVKNGGEILALNFAPDTLQENLPLEEIQNEIRKGFKNGNLKMINFENENIIPIAGERIDHLFPVIPGQKQSSKTISVVGDLKPIENHVETEPKAEWYKIEAQKFHKEKREAGRVESNEDLPTFKGPLTEQIIDKAFPGAKFKAMYDSMLSHFGNVRTIINIFIGIWQ